MNTINTTLKSGHKVTINNVPSNLDEAVKVYGSEEKLVEAANQYIIAHSLLAKARQLAFEKHINETIEMDFALPQPRAKANIGVKLDASKLSDEALEASIAALKTAGIAFTIVGLNRKQAE